MTKQLKSAPRIGIYGRSGSGKSEWLKRYLRTKKRVIILDPMDEYKFKTRIVHNSPDAIDQVRRAMLADPQGFRISFVPSSGFEADALNRISSLVWRAQAGYRDGKRGSKFITLAVEEMNLSFKVQGGENAAPAFGNICSRGRASGIEAVGVSQGIAEVSTRFRRNCSEVVIYAQADFNDRKAAARLLYMKPSDLEALPDHHFLYMKNNKVERMPPISLKK